MTSTFIEWFGWYGMAAIVLSYALVSFSILDPTDLSYQILNVTGALGIVIVSWRKRAYQPAVLNAIWVLIAFFAIINILF